MNGTVTELSALYKSPLGEVLLSSDGTSLTGLRFVDNWSGQDPRCTSVFEDACRWLDLYFDGRRPGFVPRLAFRGTRFQLSVWNALLAVPWGQTVSYGQLAQSLHLRSARAVGGAVGRNPVAIIIPCHRVIGFDGSLTGYAYGLDRKQYLLDLERGLLIP